MNKLDLIFEKQPPEVQRKLVSLLLQYNAMMQYNQKQDKFEVDLLLPFKTQKQKQEFIQNYKTRSHKKTADQSIKQQNSFTNRQHNNFITNSPNNYNSHSNYLSVHKRQQNNSQWSQQTRKPRSHQNYQNQIQEITYPERQEQAEISYDLTNQNYSIMQRRKTLSLRDVSLNIKKRIQKTVNDIKIQNSNKYVKHKLQQIQENEYDSKDQSNHGFKLNKVLVQQNEENYQQNIPSQRISNTRGNNSFRIQRDSYLNPVGQIPIQGDKGNNTQKSIKSYQSSQIKNQILIQELDDNHHFNKIQGFNKFESNNDSRKNKQFDVQDKAQSFYKNRKINYSKLDDRNQSRDQHKSRQRQDQSLQKRNIQTQNVNQLKKKLAQKYGSKKTVNPNIRQKYSQFLKKNHRDFNRIYDTIRKQIKRNQTKMLKTKRQDPILVLQQDLSEAYTEQDRIFKEQIIKDYQKQIIAENQNMSSEDLVRYFRYLLQNAKNLYVKHLRKGK